VVEQLDADHRRRCGHAQGELHVFVAWRRIAARVGVKEHRAAGAAQQALLEDLARLDRGAVQGAAKDLLLAEEPVAGVEEERPHHLLVALLESQHQEAGHVLEPVERIPARDAVAGQPAGDLASREQRAA
jgi:hypothetical protein